MASDMSSGPETRNQRRLRRFKKSSRGSKGNFIVLNNTDSKTVNTDNKIASGQFGSEEIHCKDRDSNMEGFEFGKIPTCVIGDQPAVADDTDVTGSDATDGLSPPNKLIVVSIGEPKIVMLRNTLSGGSFMKVCQRNSWFCVETAKFHHDEAAWFHFTAEVVTAVDEENQTKVFIMYLLSMEIDLKTYFLHPIDCQETSNTETFELHLSDVSRDRIITNNGIPESGLEFFFRVESRPILVMESLASPGYYLSFENEKIVMRKTLEKGDLQPNYYIEKFQQYTKLGKPAGKKKMSLYRKW